MSITLASGLVRLPHRRVCASSDNNDMAPTRSLCQVDIKSVSSAQLSKLAADVWLMSPPCQPFTLKGNRKGEDDARTASFLHLLKALREMEAPPRSILIENVVGFDTSSVHAALVDALDSKGYCRNCTSHVPRTEADGQRRRRLA